MSHVVEVGEVTTFVAADHSVAADVLVTVVPSNLDLVDAVVLSWPTVEDGERDLLALLADIRARVPDAVPLRVVR